MGAADQNRLEVGQGDPNAVALIRWLWELPGRTSGVPIVELPERLRDEATLVYCVGEQLIEFGALPPSFPPTRFGLQAGSYAWDRKAFHENVPYSGYLKAAMKDKTQRVRLTGSGELKASQLVVTVDSVAPLDKPNSSLVCLGEDCSAIRDPYDNSIARFMGKRIYLGRDTQINRLFWLLASPIGKACPLPEVQRAVDGFETSRRLGNSPQEIRGAAVRIRKAVSKLRARLRESLVSVNFEGDACFSEQNGMDCHIVIHRGGSRENPEYTLIRRFPQTERVPAKGHTIPG